MNWLQYLLEANLYMSIFYLVYCLFLNKETYYLFNRAYLLFSCVISFILPLVQLGFLRPDAPKELLVTSVVTYSTIKVHAVQVAPFDAWLTLSNCLLGVYLLGAVIFVILLIIKLNRLFRLTRNTSGIVDNQYKLVHINDSNSAFSFFNYLFIGTKALDADIIIRHELVHIRQKHSVDIILLELVKVINWFNPLVYLLQNSLKTVHEYIADEQTASYKTDPITYSAFLVNNAYGIGGPSITHSFFNYNLLKKRIIMLNQKRSGSLARLKYLVTMPVCAGLLCVSTLGFSKTYGWVVLASKSSPATVATPKVKTLKLTDGKTVCYSDKITKNGKTYTVNSLTDADKAYLLKNYKIKLEVVEIKGKPGQATMFFPSKAANDHNVYDREYTNAKGYKIREKFTVDNGVISNQVVFITEKNGDISTFFNEKITPEVRKVLADKYGYKFQQGKIINLTLAPPPPPLPPVKPVKPTPSVKADVTIDEPVSPVKPKSPLLLTVKPVKPAPPIKADITIDEPVSPQQVKSPPPPMEPYMPLTNVFAALDKYIAKYTRFPAVTLENKVTGSVIATFELNADHKMTNVKLISGIGNRCDEEAIRVLNNFTDPIDANPGTYKLAVTFTINNMKAPKPASETLSNDPSFIGEVVIEAYLK